MGNMVRCDMRFLACGVERLTNDNGATHDPPGDSGHVYCAY